MSESDIKQSAPRPPKKRPFLKIGFWLVVIYAITGFLILPPIVRSQAQKRLTKLLNRRVTIGKVSLNPFSLSATVRDFRIREPKVGTNNVTFVSWDEVYVNLQLSSIWRQAIVLHEVRIVKPYVHAQVNKDYSLNFSDLITKFSKTNAVAAPSAPGKPLAVRIHRLRIIGAAADCADLTPSRPFTRRIGPLDVSLDNFRTDPDNTNSYAFAGVTDAGEKFAWKGFFSLNPIRSQGEMLLENLALNKYAPLYQDFTKFEIRDGYIGVKGDYDIELSEGGRELSVSNVTFNMKSLKVAEKGGVSNLVELSRFIISGASVDAVRHTAEVQSIAGYGGRTVLKRDQNAAINVVELTKPPANAGGAPGGILLLLQSVTNAVQMLLDSTNQWRGTIHSVNLWDGTTTWEDLANSRPTALIIDHMELSATNISNLPGTNLTASMSLRWNTNGTVRADLSASFLPPTVDAHVKLDQIDLHPVDPYLESKVNVIILQSQMAMDATIKLRTLSNQLPDVTFAGDVRLDNLSTIDGVLGEDLLGWKSFRLSGIDANLNPPAVAIREVALDGAVTRVVVETNRTVNLLAALNLGQLGAEPEAEGTTNHLAEGVAPAAPAAALPKVTIGTVVISNAQALLIDRSIRPNTRLTLEDVNGTISNLSSEDAQHADVNIHANVFGGAPVDIVGTINPLSQGKDTDLKIELKGMDLTPASPYSGKFAGYRIAKGKLDLDLNYHIASRQLAASNIIVLDQFTFGEKVDSTNATKLPVKLAIAILKDRDGKILLDVPIGGSLDSPDFKLGKVISHAIYNIIVKIATSPFSVLGALFGGGGEEMGYQAFVPGSSVLATNETVKLDNLIKGLYARPGLEVTIEGSVDPVADRDGLRREKLEAQLRLMKWQALRKAAQAEAKPEEMVVAPDERVDFIGKLYRQIIETNATAAVWTNAVRPTTKSPAKTATTQFQQADLRKGVVKTMGGTLKAASVSTTAAGIVTPAEAASLEDVVAQSFAVTDEELTALANARAQAVKAYILQGGQVGPERVFLTESQAGGARQDGSKTVLQLQ